MKIFAVKNSWVKMKKTHCLVFLIFGIIFSGCKKNQTASVTKSDDALPSALYQELETVFAKPGKTVNMESALRNVTCIRKEADAKPETGALMFFSSSQMEQVAVNLKNLKATTASTFVPGWVSDAEGPILGLLVGNDLTGDYDIEINQSGSRIDPFDMKRSVTRPDSGNQYYAFHHYSPVASTDGTVTYTTVKMIDGLYILQVAVFEKSYSDLKNAQPYKYCRSN